MTDSPLLPVAQAINDMDRGQLRYLVQTLENLRAQNPFSTYDERLALWAAKLIEYSEARRRLRG